MLYVFLSRKSRYFAFIDPMKAESRETESRQSAVPQTRKKFKLDRIKYPHLVPGNVSLHARTMARITISLAIKPVSVT